MFVSEKLWNNYKKSGGKREEERERDPERECVWKIDSGVVSAYVCERNKYQPKVTAIKEKDITSTLPRVGKGLLPISLWWACECGYHDLGCPWTNGGKSGETYSVADKVRRPLLCHRDGCCCCCCCCCILYFLYVVTRKNHGTDRRRTHSFTLRCLKMCSFNLSAVATVPTWGGRVRGWWHSQKESNLVGLGDQ